MIDHDQFVEWARTHFEHIHVHGDEVQIPDIWWEAKHGDRDYKCHCWVNTHKNCFNAFKSGTTGNLLKIVMQMEGCDWDEAVELLGGENSIRALGERLNRLYANPEPVEEIAKGKVQLPPATYRIVSLQENSRLRIKAEHYLAGRKLKPDNLLVCDEGEYANRIIIPYYDDKHELMYFNSRAMLDEMALRYKGPAKELYGVGKADVIWMSTWPAPGTRIYLTEGEFDAMALTQAGLPAASCGGKAVSAVQAEFLRPYQVTVAFDNDKAGRIGLQVACDLLAIGIRNVKYVWPPDGFKDWNDLLIKYGENVVKGYVEARERLVTPDTSTRLGYGV